MIMPRGQEQLLLPVSGWFLWGSLLTALILNMLPVGPVTWLPDWVALFLVFWAMHQPQKVGLGVAMIFGLLVDVQQATLLGQHALVYCCLVLAVLLLRRRLVWYSLVSQATQLLPLFALAHVFLMLMQLLGDATFPGYTLILAPLLEAVVWPIISILLLAPQRRTPERDVTRPL